MAILLRTDDLFVHAKNDEAGTVAYHAQPISDCPIDAVIDRIRAAFSKRHGAALPVANQKVRGMDDLPPELQAARRQQLNLGKGVFCKNTVYVVQQAHNTPEEVKYTIFHELYGYAATAALFGGEWLAKQNELLKAIGGGAGLYRLAAANQIDLHAYAAGLAADTSLYDEQRRAVMTDELLAHLGDDVRRVLALDVRVLGMVASVCVDENRTLAAKRVERQMAGLGPIHTATGTPKPPHRRRSIGT
jgi:hypothetical protein